MKDIELCGFGNGLVDILIDVNDSEFSQFGANKGDMILIDDEKRNFILDKLKDKKLNYCSGGSAANTIIAFSELGGKAAYNTVLGIDELSQFYIDEFKDLGIILNAGRVDSHSTGTCVVAITPDSERTMFTHLSATALFNSGNIDEDIIKRSEWIYIEGYKFSEPSSTEAIFKALELSEKYDTKVAVTFSDTFITALFGDNLRKVVEKSQLIFCNENEALSFTQTSSISEASEKLKSMVPNFVITLGAKGSLIYWKEVMYEIPAFLTKSIDTTGAGDMFAGAFFYGIIKDKNPIKAGHLASLASSKIVAQIGPRPQFNMKEIYQQVSGIFE